MGRHGRGRDRDRGIERRPVIVPEEGGSIRHGDLDTLAAAARRRGRPLEVAPVVGRSTVERVASLDPHAEAYWAGMIPSVTPAEDAWADMASLQPGQLS